MCSNIIFDRSCGNGVELETLQSILNESKIFHETSNYPYEVTISIDSSDELNSIDEGILKGKASYYNEINCEDVYIDIAIGNFGHKFTDIFVRYTLLHELAHAIFFHDLSSFPEPSNEFFIKQFEEQELKADEFTFKLISGHSEFEVTQKFFIKHFEYLIEDYKQNYSMDMSKRLDLYKSYLKSS